MFDACRVRNSRHVPVGPRRRHPRIYLATVLEETRNPNRANWPGCAFDPKGDSRQPCVRSELEALARLLDGRLFLYERTATSSTPSNPLAASPNLFPVSQSATDAANR